MLDLRWIRENPGALDDALRKRGAEPASARVLELDAALRAVKSQVQEAQARRNAASKEIGKAKGKGGDPARAEALMAEVAALKEKIAEGEEKERALDRELHDLLASIPNVPQDDVPVGADESANVELVRWGEPRAFDFPPKQHFELGEALGQMDFEAAARMSGARFTVLKAGLARLERALGQFMLDLHTQAPVTLEDGREIGGYTEVNPPLLVRDDAAFGTAQLPKFADDLFRIDLRAVAQNLWLIPTAEVSLTNLVREQIIPEAEFPLRFTALTPCFRAEAGAAGKDTRGMIRQHQFTKVELVSITTPEQSAAEHERMTGCAEEVLRRLELPYRKIVLSTGDMGFAARKTYDLEVWLPGQNAYREISSCSNCGDFQARRMDARFRPADGGKPQFVHTLNGSGLAVGRTLIAVMENYQEKDGSIRVPDALIPYMGGLNRIG